MTDGVEAVAETGEDGLGPVVGVLDRIEEEAEVEVLIEGQVMTATTGRKNRGTGQHIQYF